MHNDVQILFWCANTSARGFANIFQKFVNDNELKRNGTKIKKE